MVIHSYRHRMALADGFPRYAAIERRLALQPMITVPTIRLDDDADGVVAATDGKRRRRASPAAIASSGLATTCRRKRRKRPPRQCCSCYDNNPSTGGMAPRSGAATPDDGVVDEKPLANTMVQ